MTNSDGIVLGLDADGVLLNYLKGFIAFLRSRGHVIGLEAHEIRDWSMTGVVPGLDSDGLFVEIEAFSLTREFSEIEPIADAVEAIRRIKDSFEGIKVVAITSAGSLEETARLRRMNLAVFPIDEIHVLPLGASKAEHLAKLPAGSIFVDDLYKHVKAAESVGCRGVLFRQPYNVGDDHPHVISDWKNGLDVIMGLLREDRTPRIAA